MRDTSPGDDHTANPAWTGAARFLEGRIPPGQTVIAPAAFEATTGALAPPDPAVLPDWAVVETAGAGALPGALLQRLLAETTPVYANEGYVVFARRPTFGLASLRNAAPVRALADAAASGSTPPSPPFAGPGAAEASAPGSALPPEAAIMPSAPPRAPEIPKATLPPEALALRVPPARQADPPAPPSMPPGMPEMPRIPVPPTPALKPEPPPSNAAAAPARGAAGWGGLPARIGPLLGEAAGRRVAAIGHSQDLAAAALPPSALISAEGPQLPPACFDLALVLAAAEPPARELAEAARLLRQGGLVLAIAENADSLGRRLAAALGRAPTTSGLSAAALRGAAQAAGLVPVRLEGHSLDTWRAQSDAPPAGLLPDAPAAALLEEAGEAAGPRHAAWLLLLARKN
ncbi:hypothetical protein [Muricoccus pecuniae]|uniref:Methyltransferase domain-containing protein n=1 Tax=Muricoccus pecuniae TaxID=693023 RepID=A0A840YFW3_9PROT|nr:hypothetical protein [Roseomonas pecuniae]MBB5693372.1 hypothetical protein [Roseomonas pecuniae]